MAKRKSNIEIGQRALYEALRIWNNAEKAKREIGTKSNRLLYDWSQGVAPSAMYLQRLHYCGADVIYILTGVRTKQ